MEEGDGERQGRRDGVSGKKVREREKTKIQLMDMGKTERDIGRKNERKGQREGVMEEQMNRDLITRPLCPESVG